MRDATLVMTGRLADFGLADVLQVVGLSRQFTAVELRRSDGKLFGTIWIKAGRVIDAQREDVRGRPAFFDLFGPQPEVFVVSRLPEPPAYRAPLGMLPALLVSARDATARGVAPAAPIAAGQAQPPRPPLTPGPAPRPPAARTPPTPVPVVEQRQRPALASVPNVTARPAAPPPPPLRPDDGDLDDEWADGSRTDAGRPGGVAVAVASPKGGVGKTTITLNLAIAVARRGHRTIVIDGDINGDLMSLLAARDRVKRGVYDILDAPAELETVLRGTAVPQLRVLPASGPELPSAAIDRRGRAGEWRALIARARELADVVLVDCPAGMFDATGDVLAACSHVLGVLQSEMIAMRSAAMFERGLEALPADARPELVGMVVNMFHGKSEASVEAFQSLASRHAKPLLETTIPRSEAFAAASQSGVPLGFVDGDGQRSSLSWLFDMLANEICERTGLAEPAQPKVASTQFLL